MGLELAIGVNNHGERSENGEDGVSDCLVGVSTLSFSANAGIDVAVKTTNVNATERLVLLLISNPKAGSVPEPRRAWCSSQARDSIARLVMGAGSRGRGDRI